MSEVMKIVLALGGFVALLMFAFGRYEIVGIGGGESIGHAYVLNRITGEVRRCVGANCIFLPDKSN